MLRKRVRREAFKDVVSARGVSIEGHPRDGQATRRVADDGLWDDTGKFWPAADSYLALDEVVALLEGGDVEIGVQAGYGRDVVFHASGQAKRVWVEQIREHFAPEGDLDVGGWPNHVAYVAELRQRPDGGRLLWFRSISCRRSARTDFSKELLALPCPVAGHG